MNRNQENLAENVYLNYTHNYLNDPNKSAKSVYEFKRQQKSKSYQQTLFN